MTATLEARAVEAQGAGAKIVSVNPVRTGYSAIADEWVPIRPGTDGLLVFALIHELLRTERVDLDYLASLTDASWLTIDAPGEPDDGLYARDPEGTPRCRPAACWGGMLCRTGAKALRSSSGWRRAIWTGLSAGERGRALRGAGLHHPAAGRRARACGVRAADPGRAALDRHERAAARGFAGRPVAMHAMRGISAHSNGFQTCRALHLLQLLLGTIDVPGGWRYKAPYPRPSPPGPRPFGKLEEVAPGSRWRACRWGSRAGRRTCWSTATGGHCGSTRPSAGTRRWRSTACCRR